MYLIDDDLYTGELEEAVDSFRKKGLIRLWPRNKVTRLNPSVKCVLFSSEPFQIPLGFENHYSLQQVLSSYHIGALSFDSDGTLSLYLNLGEMLHLVWKR